MTSSGTPGSEAAVLSALARHGLLLVHDPHLPSATTIIAGSPVAGSWWSHPLAHEIYRVLNEVEAHPDVLSVKLVKRKLTFVHRRLWPALVSVARAREPWQLAGLSRDARSLLKTIDDGQTPETHGKAVKELETRLLAHSEQVHTAEGKHATRLESWSAWARRVACRPRAISEGKRALEGAAAAIGRGRQLLPWN